MSAGLLLNSERSSVSERVSPDSSVSPPDSKSLFSDSDPVSGSEAVRSTMPSGRSASSVLPLSTVFRSPAQRSSGSVSFFSSLMPG